MLGKIRIGLGLSIEIGSQLLLPIFSTEKKIREAFSYREYYGDCSVRLKISSLFGALSRKVLLKTTKEQLLAKYKGKEAEWLRQTFGRDRQENL